MTLANPQECVDRLIAMLNNESKSYLCTDYIKDLKNPTAQKVLNNRHQICSWMYQLLDHQNIDRKIAYHGMNLLDRYVSNIISNRDKHQQDVVETCIGGSQLELASLTALYLAMKLNGRQSQPLQISGFEMIGRGKFKAADICRMELKMLSELSWHVFPPTSSEYVDNYVSLLKYFHCRVQGLPSQSYQVLPPLFIKIFEVSVFLTELAVLHYFIVPKKASTVAFASVLIAMQKFQCYVTGEEYCAFLTVLETIGLSHENQDVVLCTERLQELYDENMPDMHEEQKYSERGLSSPVSVTQM